MHTNQSLLDRIQIRKSHLVRREIDRVSVPVEHLWTDFSNTTIATKEIPCMEVLIPDEDWGQIVRVIQAHERAHKHPAVQAAWQQYLITRELVHVQNTA